MSSITLVHPAKAGVRNEMPTGKENRVVSSNTIKDRAPGPRENTEKGRFGESELRNSEPPVRSDAAYRQITLALLFNIYTIRKCRDMGLEHFTVATAAASDAKRQHNLCRTSLRQSIFSRG